MIFDINECIFESNRNIKNVCNFAKKLFHIKLYQGFQRKTIDNFIYDNFHKLEKYINNVESNFSKYTNDSYEIIIDNDLLSIKQLTDDNYGIKVSGIMNKDDSETGSITD